MDTRRLQTAATEPKRRAAVYAPLFLLLALSSAVNTALAWKVMSLRQVILYLKSEHMLKAGMTVPPLEGKTVDGSSTMVKYDEVSVPTILYVFSPSCGWCARNIENLRKLQQGTSGRYRLVGVSLSGRDLKAYIERERLTFPIYTDVPEALRQRYRLGGTPHTIVVSTSGKVLQTWMGAFDGEQKTAVEKALRIRLPGLNSGGHL